MRVKIKRVDNTLPLPQYQTEGAVGFDVYSRIDAVIGPKEYGALPNNLVIETPSGYMLALVARSSTFKKKGLVLANAIGIFDPDFCGEDDEMIIQVYNMTEADVKVERGERIAQGIFIPVAIADWEEVEKMKEISRGGIGSTDKKVLTLG